MDQHEKVTDLKIKQYMWLATLLGKGVYVLFLRDTFVTDEQMYTILYSKYVYAIYADKGPIGKVQNRLYNVIGNTF